MSLFTGKVFQMGTVGIKAAQPEVYIFFQETVYGTGSHPRPVTEVT